MIDDSKPFELLSEIAKLFKRYGKETFYEAAAILRDPNFSNQVADFLENIANRTLKGKNSQKRLTATEERVKFRETLVDLGKSDPDKSKILLSLLDSLHDKTILPSLRELIDFISDHGLPVPKAKSRDKVIIAFVKNCKKLPLSELPLFHFQNEKRHTLENSDRSLEGWGKVILDRKSK